MWLVAPGPVAHQVCIAQEWRSYFVSAARALQHAGAGETLVEAILDVYPTWHALWSAYKTALAQQRAIGHPEPDKKAELLLADIPVGSIGLGGGLSGCRTVGRELSRKVYRCLFSSAPAITR